MLLQLPKYETLVNQKYTLKGRSQNLVLDDKAIAERRECEESLWYFFLKVWEVLEPSTPLATNWHLELICEHLELVDAGVNKKFLVNIAPRHLKSKLCSVAFPVWQWLRRPSLTHLCCSYISTLANDLSDDRRTLIESDWFRSIFPELELSKSKNRISEFKNNFRGEMNSRGLESGITGIGGLIHIYDDPNDPDKVESDSIRDRTLRRYKDYSVGRRNDPVDYGIVVIQQRTHESDISGYILDEDPDFVTLILPTVAEVDETIVFPKSGRTIERKEGDLLHPERFGQEQVDEAKKTLGSFMFASRHQQRPIPREGGIIKEQWWQFYLAPPPCQFKIWSWDTAQEAKAINDYSVGILLGRFNYNYYILDVCRERLEFPELKRRIVALHNRDQTNAVLIEKKSSGHSLLQELKRISSLPLIPQPVQGDKTIRAIAVSPTIESGRVYLPHQAPWLADFLSEVTKFPNVVHDDQVDALSQGLNYIVTNGTSFSTATTGRKRGSSGVKY